MRSPRSRSARGVSLRHLRGIVSATLALFLPRVVVGALGASLDCGSETDAAATLTPCASGAGAECCAGLDAWDHAGCFCDGAASIVSLSHTYTALVEAAAPSCPDLERSVAAGDPHCAAVPTAPGLPTWAYAAVDGAELRLTWSAEGTTGATAASTAAVAFLVTHCDPGADSAAVEQSCVASRLTETIDATLGDVDVDAAASRSYDLAISPPRTFVLITAVDAAGRTARLAGPFDVVNYDPRDATVANRTFLAPAVGVASSSVAADAARCGDWSAPCGTLPVALEAAKRRRGVRDAAADASIVADVFALPGTHDKVRSPYASSHTTASTWCASFLKDFLSRVCISGLGVWHLARRLRRGRRGGALPRQRLRLRPPRRRPVEHRV